MGRSVSCPSDAIARCYQHVDIEDEFCWGDLVESIRWDARQLLPDGYDEDRFIGREDHAVYESGRHQVGVSEYCGLVCIWLRRRDDDDEDEVTLRDQVFEKNLVAAFDQHFSRLVPVGTASNGVTFFRTIR